MPVVVAPGFPCQNSKPHECGLSESVVILSYCSLEEKEENTIIFCIQFETFPSQLTPQNWSTYIKEES